MCDGNEERNILFMWMVLHSYFASLPSRLSIISAVVLFSYPRRRLMSPIERREGGSNEGGWWY